jgi:hypothetical protein
LNIYIVDGIRDVLNKLRHWQIYYVKMEANSTAHGLAKITTTRHRSSVLDEILKCIYAIVLGE